MVCLGTHGELGQSRIGPVSLASHGVKPWGLAGAQPESWSLIQSNSLCPIGHIPYTYPSCEHDVSLETALSLLPPAPAPSISPENCTLLPWASIVYICLLL